VCKVTANCVVWFRGDFLGITARHSTAREQMAINMHDDKEGWGEKGQKLEAEAERGELG
jgi:hypothetical protein